MELEISQKERQMLIELLESRMSELHPTIRRSRVSSVTDELKHDLEDVERLLEKVRGEASEGET
jgi:Ribonuclease G/E